MKDITINRSVSLDLLKVFLAIMIIGIHSDLLSSVNLLYNHFFVQGFFRIAVPIFFIINGYFFNKTINKKTLLKWYARIIPLYLFWMLFYSPFWYMNHDLTFIQAIKRLVMGYYHLWYIPAMVGAATILYFLTRLISKVKLFYIAMILFLIGVSFQYLNNFNFISLPFRNVIFFGIPFFFIGYLINFINLDFFNNKILLILFIISFVILLLESYLTMTFFNRDANWDLLFSLFFLSPVIFVIFLKNNFTTSILKVSFYSSGLYFIHPLCLKFFDFLKVENDIYIFTSTIFICLLITKLLTCINSSRYIF